MFKKVTLAAVVAAGLAAAVPAHASLTLTGNPDPCTTSDPVCNWNVNGYTGTSGSFSQSATFTLPKLGTSSSSITTSTTDGFTGNIDFSRIFLTAPDGVTTYDYLLTPTGNFESGSILISTMAGTWTLTVEGTADTAAAYGGNITFSAVPEPAAWALMIVGFGAVGFSMRRRSEKAGTTRASLKFA